MVIGLRSGPWRALCLAAALACPAAAALAQDVAEELPAEPTYDGPAHDPGPVLGDFENMKVIAADLAKIREVGCRAELGEDDLILLSQNYLQMVSGDYYRFVMADGEISAPAQQRVLERFAMLLPDLLGMAGLDAEAGDGTLILTCAD